MTCVFAYYLQNNFSVLIMHSYVAKVEYSFCSIYFTFVCAYCVLYIFGQNNSLAEVLQHTNRDKLKQ